MDHAGMVSERPSGGGGGGGGSVSAQLRLLDVDAGHPLANLRREARHQPVRVDAAREEAVDEDDGAVVGHGAICGRPYGLGGVGVGVLNAPRASEIAIFGLRKWRTAC